MRFTIRHLLWFTLLAAIACWWWMPSADDARITDVLVPLLDKTDSARRFSSKAAFDHNHITIAGSNQDFGDFDFAHRDIFIELPNLRGRSSWENATLTIYCRGRGHFVLICEADTYFTTLFGLAVSVAKGASIFECSKTQVHLIDGGIAAGLLTLAIGSLFMGRKRQPNHRLRKPAL